MHDESTIHSSGVFVLMFVSLRLVIVILWLTTTGFVPSFDIEILSNGGIRQIIAFDPREHDPEQTVNRIQQQYNITSVEASVVSGNYM